MKIRTPAFALLIGLFVFAAALSLVTPQPAYAQICTDPATGAVIPCPPREKRTKVPTPVPPTRTPTPTPTPAGLPITGGEAGGAASDGIHGTPAVQLRAFSPTGFLIGLLILVLLLGGVFGRRKGLFKRFGVFGHSTNTGPPGKNFILDLSSSPDAAPLGRNDGFVQQVDLSHGGAEPGATGLGEVDGNDQSIGLGPQKIYLARNDGRVQQINTGHDSGTDPWASSYDPGSDADSPNYNWDQHGNVDANSDGTHSADQGDSSDALRKPPEDA
jgi:hypothetical protein